jgi:hypothetical protein
LGKESLVGGLGFRLLVWSMCVLFLRILASDEAKTSAISFVKAVRRFARQNKNGLGPIRSSPFIT